jgi:uncharacterized protein
MAKAPVPGRVKTRLCPPCDAHQAAAIAEAALRDTLRAALECGPQPVLLALDGEPGPWLPTGVRVVAQCSGTLNARLADAWQHLPSGGVQIGMDTPQVSPGLLGAALAAVDEHGSTLGPATDGGWWLLGLHRPMPSLFDGVPMSTPTSGARQLARMHVLGLRPRALASLTDIDTWATARLVAADIPGSDTAAAVAAVSDSLLSHDLGHRSRTRSPLGQRA